MSVRKTGWSTEAARALIFTPCFDKIIQLILLHDEPSS